MAKSENQKLKLLYLMDYFREKTDEEHGVSRTDMENYLESMDIKVERKTLYNDIEELQKYGLDIDKEKKGKNTYYKLLNREFELPELKLLVDAVQSSKFITKKKTEELCRKLGKLTSEAQARELNRQVYVVGELKNLNEKIYLIVDALHRAINEDYQVEFQYTAWSVDKKLVPKHGGRIYHVSPWGLTWDDENYYLVGYDGDDEKIKHFRVDKLLHLELTSKKRIGREAFDKVDMKQYAKKVFGMFSGEKQRVKFLVDADKIGIIFDRFGTDVMVIPQKGSDQVLVNVDVELSTQFIGWLVGIGTGIRVLEPANVREKIAAHLDEVRRLYEN